MSMQTVYQRVLQDRFQRLHPALQQFLGAAETKRAVGFLTVIRQPGRIRNLLAAIMGIPPMGGYNMRLDVVVQGHGEVWTRRFDRHVLRTYQCEFRGLLVEASGPARIGFDLSIDAGALCFRPRRAWFLGLPLPLWLAPRIEADNTVNEQGGWHIVVRLGVPILGGIAQYEGDVAMELASNGSVTPTSDHVSQPP